ncbi:zinc-ribbon and DUF3426 domain-containing protein [Paraburkholderia sp. J41]|uniref:zinc-ribbon and DUF3426 domain-containing protein n=1 Tax=Paraburkholderia sp. J41 TaxID=2805433 RepID=UPI002AC34662|nr:zinc-ribbon and DUF3426 domain-containing protein [Paraburkholderia sp. J41]
MLLATRCPFCETVFRIQPTQLAVRRGLVRCGHCQEAFDATGSLYEMPEGSAFVSAVPVSAELAASLTAPLDPRSATHPALNADLHADLDADLGAQAPAPLRTALPPDLQPELPSDLPPDLPPPLPDVPQPAAHAEAKPETPAPIHEAAPPQPGEAPNFSNRAWDPWAPPTQSHLDPRLQYNADRLPQAGLAPGATPGVTPNVEARVIVDDPTPAAPRGAVAPAAPFAPTAPVVPDASAEPVDVPAPAPAASAPQAASAAHAAASVAASAAAQSAQSAQSAEAAEPFPPATRWTRVEPGLGAAGSVEPTLSLNEASRASVDDTEPTLARNPSHAQEPVRAAAPLAAEPQQPPRQAAPEPAPMPAFSALESNEGNPPFAVTREAPARARAQRRAGWRILGVIVSLLLLALLVVQLAWWQRETVMVYWPDSQPLYLKACAQLGCRVLPPRDIDGLLVEPSDLRQVDNEPHHLELKVPLRNRFNVALAYPAIELSLLDRQNNIVVRRVLWPQDYVTPGTHVEAGLPAHTTQTMIVRLDTGDVVASNFRIEIFYP